MSECCKDVGMLPVNELSHTSNSFFRFTRSPMDAGMLPVNALSLSFRASRLASLRMDVGMLSVKKLPLTLGLGLGPK